MFGLWLGVVSGTLLPLKLPFLLPLDMLWGMVALVGGVAFFLFSKSIRVVKLSWLIGVLSFCFSMALTTSRIHDRLIHRWPESLAKSTMAVEGWIDDLPRNADYGIRFSLRVTGMSRAKVLQYPERLWLTAYRPSYVPMEAFWHPRAGECWRFNVRLKPLHGLMNPHTFNAENWFLSQGFDATGYLVSRSSMEHLMRCSASWTDPFLQSLQQTRQVLKDRIQAVLGDAPYAGVIIALVIGDQPAISDMQWQRFNATGISHLISISGFHITFLAGVIVWLVTRLIRRSPRCMDIAPDKVWGAIAGLGVAIGYVLLAGGGVPAIRTAWMMGLVTLAWSLGRWAQAGTLFVWATVGVLWMDSFAPLSAGFWLSFAGVGALMLSGHGGLPRKTNGWRMVLREVLHSQKIATLTLAPITLYLFSQVSLVGPVANAAAIPAVSVLVTPLAICGALVPGMGWLLHWAHVLFAELDRILLWLTQLSVLPAFWRGAQPSLWATLWATAGMMYMCGPVMLPMRRYVGGISILPLLVLPSVPVHDGDARVTVLDVGQGMSVLVETSHHRLLYDAGPRSPKAAPMSGADAGARVVLPFLWGEGIHALDTLLISHHDIDHRGGADSLLAKMPIHVLLTSVDPETFPTRSQETQYQKCEAGQHWMWDGVVFQILSPSAERLENERRSNDRSCVLHVRTAATSVMIPGDAEISVEKELVDEQPQQLKSTILIAGHHGSRSSTSSEWLKYVQPVYTVFTSGYLNRYHHPHPLVLERVQASGSLAFRSDYDGAIRFDLPAQKVSIRPVVWREEEKRAWNFH